MFIYLSPAKLIKLLIADNINKSVSYIVLLLYLIFWLFQKPYTMFAA